VPPGEHVIQVILASGRDDPVAIAPFVPPEAGGTVLARSGPAGAPTAWGSQRIQVGDHDVTGVVLSVRAASKVTGRVEFRGSAPRPPTAEVAGRLVTFERVDGIVGGAYAHPIAGVTLEGEVASTGILPGRYFVNVPEPPRGWTVDSILVGGRDASDEPVELGYVDVSGMVVVLTDSPGVLSGTVRTTTGTPDPTAAVIIFPTERERWRPAHPRRMKRVTTASDGSFRIVGLPSGSYLAVVIPAADPVAWRAARTLERLASAATPVFLREREHRQVALTSTWLGR
jgi:hypothetical protein